MMAAIRAQAWAVGKDALGHVLVVDLGGAGAARGVPERPGLRLGPEDKIGLVNGVGHTTRS
jgi:hypothetical protein